MEILAKIQAKMHEYHKETGSMPNTIFMDYYTHLKLKGYWGFSLIDEESVKHKCFGMGIVVNKAIKEELIFVGERL